MEPNSKAVVHANLPSIEKVSIRVSIGAVSKGCNDDGECEDGAPEGYSCDIPVQGGSQEYCCDMSDVKKGLESDDDSLPSPDKLKENLKERFGSNSDSSDSDDDSFDTEENIERRTGRSDEDSEEFGDSEDSDGREFGDTEFGRSGPRFACMAVPKDLQIYSCQQTCSEQ
ncbi:hypothetical protein Ddc_18661 [Ditylenchus destructor]|nr:hypothetical protein Ddc_18661 [Ditylenchus destructor]